ncbi:hypothetical protein [Peribacillus frigoritolerans]|uniref:hypothetical protein n=1 Tax=Peribacillus frigoritolerans TaxID=450367 RepID=UPI0024C10A6C|nr:hypothetical protein [Peribacillus frigoritolerans]WHX59889.1 hypothetical protein QNH33_14645 [Peribacillus frigoritolerans]
METGNSKIDVTLIIVFLTGIAYVLAYTFEFSYQNYYHLPKMFIDLNINTMTHSLFVIISILGLMCFVSFSITDFFLKSSPTWGSIPPFAVVAYSLIALAIATLGGSFFASNKEEYFVLKQNKELFIVVTPYKDNLVIAPLDIETDTMTPKFQVIEMKAIKDTEVIKFKEGLNIEDLKSSKNLKEEQKK